MFDPTIKPSFASRSRTVLAAVRGLLLLEDDLDVDWEVDQEPIAAGAHPHRERLRRPWRSPRDRRPGQPPAAEQTCLCALERSPSRGLSQPVDSRLAVRSHPWSRPMPDCTSIR